MKSNLLICAAIDFGASGWVEGIWRDVVGSLKPGIAGGIWQYQDGPVGFALRQDAGEALPTPQVNSLQLRADEAGFQTLLAGRIFHRQSIASQLNIAPPPTDSELYAAAFREWGEDCDQRLLGSYAAVQWHSKQHKLRLARSALQAPPLHVWRSGQRVIAASLVRTILAGGLDARINADQIANVGLRNFTNPSRSYFRGVDRVAPGTIWTIDRERAQRRQFWQPMAVKKLAKIDHRAAVEEAERLLDQAVATALEGVSRPAMSLSGGLDSQTVACAVLGQIGADESLRSYTSVPVHDWLPKADARLAYDESENVRRLARHHANLHANFVTAKDFEFGAYSQELMRLGDWPTANEMNMHWVHAIHHQASADGCDVMLHAELGDSSISYDALTAFPNWLIRGRWYKLLKELGAYEDGRPLAKRAVSLSCLPLLPIPLRRMLDGVRGNRGADFTRWSPLRKSHSVVQAAIERARADGHDIRIYSGTNSISSRAAMIAAPLSEGPELDLSLRLLHGIERRDPTAYRPLWEFCASLPDDIFMHEGQSRKLARLLLARRGPRDIADQERVGIQSADFRGRLQRDAGQLIKEVDELLEQNGPVQILDLDRVKDILESLSGPEALQVKDWLQLTSFVPRGIALARFIRHVEQHDE